MAREIKVNKMSALPKPEYLGAFMPEERRLVLVSMDPKDPWEAFRRMRRVMRTREEAGGSAILDIYEAPAPLEHQAQIISLESRRRAG